MNRSPFVMVSLTSLSFALHGRNRKAHYGRAVKPDAIQAPVNRKVRQYCRHSRGFVDRVKGVGGDNILFF